MVFRVIHLLSAFQSNISNKQQQNQLAVYVCVGFMSFNSQFRKRIS